MYYSLSFFLTFKNCFGWALGRYSILGLGKTPSMCIGLLFKFLLWKMFLDGHSATLPFWVQKNIRVCAIGFLVVFYFEKLFWTGFEPLFHFGFMKIFEYVHCAFLSFSILENVLGRAFGCYAILGSEKYPIICITLCRSFLLLKIVLDGLWAAIPFWV